ncbi:MAG TPA: sigma-70 family RNA polymerase sigma factor [Terriglobia bacterium]|nr:sigma-70 family RNA polymerase sigma factor [Terriglobia bacterium]
MTSPTGASGREASDELNWPDLARECGARLTDPVLWARFQRRFEKPILTFLLRAVRRTHPKGDIQSLVNDLTQDVYVRLVADGGRLLRSFRGETEYSVLAFLASVSMHVHGDYIRRSKAQRREGDPMPIEDAQVLDLIPRHTIDVGAMLKWSDVERLIQSESDSRTATRNVLICKLHFIEGLTAEEIAQYPTFELTANGVEAVLRRMKARLERRADEL